MRSTFYHDSLHLTEKQIESALDVCPLCGSSSRRAEVLPLQKAPRIALLKCMCCRGCSASFMPKPEVLDAYYADYYKGTALRITCANPYAFAQHIVQRMTVQTDGSSIRMLDVGGGDGTLGQAVATMLRRRHPSAEIILDVVDYGPLTSQSPDWLLARLLRSLDAVEGKYDVVIASSVVEHIPQAQAALQKIFRAVRPQGWFYARTPFIVPFARLVGGTDFTYPGHLHDMGCEFWNRITETFALDARIVSSRPSFVETTLAQSPLRTVMAHLLKLPAHIEGALSPIRRKDRWWTLVGGWEIVLQFGPSR